MNEHPKREPTDSTKNRSVVLSICTVINTILQITRKMKNSGLLHNIMTNSYIMLKDMNEHPNREPTESTESRHCIVHLRGEKYYSPSLTWFALLEGKEYCGKGSKAWSQITFFLPPPLHSILSARN